MTNFINLYPRKAMHSDRYDDNYVEDVDDDDDDLDDDDAYDGLSDYEDEDLVRSRSYGRHNYSSIDGENGGPDIDSRRQRSISEGNMMEPNEDNRRDHHNQLERKRRASIKSSYNDLREAIASLRGSKASRAVILQRAVECIEELVKLNRDHTHCVDMLKRQNDLLDSRVQELQRLVQRVDGEEVCNNVTINCSNNNNSGSGQGHINHANNVALRLISRSSTSNTSNIPMYRCLPQDSVNLTRTNDELSMAISNDHPTTPMTQSSCPLSTTNQSLPVCVSQPSFVTSNRVSTRYGSNSTNSFTGELDHIQTVTAIPNLIVSTQSPFSSTISSFDGSSAGLARSNSQRSSPSGMSSSSCSSTTHRIEDDSNGAGTHAQKTGCTGLVGSVDHVLFSIVKPNSSTQTLVKSSTSTTCSSPPSIVSNISAIQSNHKNSNYGFDTNTNIDNFTKERSKRRKL